MFKTKLFAKWAHKAGITDSVLVKSAREIGAGLIDAKLGHNLIKKRIPVGK